MSDDEIESNQHTSFPILNNPDQKNVRTIRSRRWSIASSLIFMLGSFSSLIAAIATILLDMSINNIGQVIGYFVYSLAYITYLYAEYKYNKYHYVYSTVIFIVGSLIFVIFSIYDTVTRKDFSINNLSTMIGNIGWLIGYILSFRSELLSPSKTNLDLLSIPIMHHNNP